ncbi:MAG TPA: bifunctional nicotinamide-nucleotide adenylyltransferase/Nudix hydroxylase [Candidatus Saccharimonadales bacterium]
MSTRPFEFSIFIGRFQPFHMAHYELVKEALKQADTAIVVIGSYKKAPSPKHPWSGEEREAMMRASLTPEENQRVKVVFSHDYLYKPHLWFADVPRQVEEIIGESESVVLVGHEHDHSSDYLKGFPQWKKHLLPNIDSMPHATAIRYSYFTYDNSYKASLHPKTVEYLEEFKKTPKFKSVKAYFDAVRAGKSEWVGAPFPPIFHTVDSVVIKSGHILCVRRGKAYGGGQIALPGGFLNEHELRVVGAIRELKEETAIALSKEELTNYIKNEHEFDHPDRSERGRTITSAYFLDLGTGPLVKVKGGDDAAKAWWMPINEFYSREEEFFEDHYHIIDYFVGSAFTK